MGRPWRKKDRVAAAPPPDAEGDYKWSSQSYTLRDIMTNFKLPVVVQCREDTSPDHMQVGGLSVSYTLGLFAYSELA